MLKEPENLDLLLKQRNAHEDLAASQLESLLMRQKQLQILEEKLKTMEVQIEDYPQKSIILKQKQLEQFERQLASLEESFNSEIPANKIDQMENVESITTENYANNMMADFPADLQVQRQTLEKLAYLEDQLAQLKELKAQMIEGAEIMEKRHNEVKDIHEIATAPGKDQAADVFPNNETKPEHFLKRSELEVATDAMLSYLNMKEKKEGGENVDEEALLQQLMERLMAASVDKNDLLEDSNLRVSSNTDNQEENLERQSENENAENDHEYQRLLDQENFEDDDPIQGEEAMTEILATSERIDLAINGLNHQINQVKISENLITTEKERLYFEEVLSKLESQMTELIEIREKINCYKELLDQNQEIRQLEEEMTEMRNVQENTLFDADFSSLEAAPEAHVEVEKVEGAAVAAEAVNAVNDFPHVQEKERKDEEPIVETQTAFEVVQDDTLTTQSHQVRVEKRQEEDYVPIRTHKFSPRPSSSMSFVSGMTRKAPTARIKKLFEHNRESIYQNAATFITAYEARPHFLLSLFQKLTELVDDDVAQQELLLMLDEMIHVKNEEDLENTEMDMSEAELLQRFSNEVVE